MERILYIRQLRRHRHFQKKWVFKDICNTTETVSSRKIRENVVVQFINNRDTSDIRTRANIVLECLSISETDCPKDHLCKCEWMCFTRRSVKSKSQIHDASRTRKLFASSLLKISHFLRDYMFDDCVLYESVKSNVKTF